MCDSQATRRLMFTGMAMISLFPVVTYVCCGVVQMYPFIFLSQNIFLNL